LLADVVHNAGDALTTLPVGAAFLLRSPRAERWAGYAVVLAIFVSACVAFWQSIERLIHPEELSYLWALAAAGALGFVRERDRGSGSASYRSASRQSRADRRRPPRQG
jgi:divalent metal cation (Fe/Co/Zn/Cd) transporter